GGGLRQKFRLEDAVLPVTNLGPGIGEEDEQVGEREPGRKRLQEKSRLGVHKEDVAQSGAVALSERALNSLPDDVDADAKPLGVGLRIGGQKVAVPAPDLPGKGRRPREDARELRAYVISS